MDLRKFYYYQKGKGGGGISNLFKATEDFDSSIDWNKLPSTDAPSITGGITDPDGGSTAQRINFTDNRQARVQQRVVLSASTQYTFSVYARVNTGTQQFRLRNVTLGEAEAKTATTSWTRFEYTFTTTTGGNYDLSIQNTDNVAKTIEFWGAMLNVGSSAVDYVKVDPSISGSTPTPEYTGFGDIYGGVVSYYSTRRFTDGESFNAIRVRRSSDNTEQDIGFDGEGNLDTTALLAFVGTGGTDNGYVTTWYDQTGNNDITNGSASEQPQIVVGGSVTTKGGETAIKFNSLEYLQKESASTSWVDETNVSIFSVFSCVDFAHTSEATKETLYNISGDEVSGGNGNSLGAMTRNSQLRVGFYDQGAGSYGQKQGLQSPPNDTQILVSSIYDSTTTLTTTLNATTTGTVTSNPELSLIANTYTLGALHNGAKLLDGTIQEFIVFASDETSNQSGIESNINTYFDIY